MMFLKKNHESKFNEILLYIKIKYLDSYHEFTVEYKNINDLRVYNNTKMLLDKFNFLFKNLKLELYCPNNIYSTEINGIICNKKICPGKNSSPGVNFALYSINKINFVESKYLWMSPATISGSWVCFNIAENGSIMVLTDEITLIENIPVTSDIHTENIIHNIRQCTDPKDINKINNLPDKFKPMLIDQIVQITKNVYDLAGCEISGTIFNQLVAKLNVKLIKLTNHDECHNGLQFVTGLNVDPIVFNPNGSCSPGGIYFTDSTHIYKWVTTLPYTISWIRRVIIPDDARVYIESNDKIKADKIILGGRKLLFNIP